MLHEEKSTKKFNNIDIWRITRDNSINKVCLVIRDFLTAFVMAKNNEVYYITDDEEQFNLFKQHVINSIHYGLNDKAALIKDWRKILEFIDEKFGKNIMFDIIMGNPPYGSCKDSNNNIHYIIAEQLNKKFNEKMILIMPHRVLYATSNKFDHFKKQFNNVSNIIEVDSKEYFEDTNMEDDGVFVFENDIPKELVVTYKNNEVKTFKNLLNVDPIFSNFEMKFMERLYNEKPNYNPYRPCRQDDKTVKFNAHFCSRFSIKDKYFVCSNLANGAIDGRFFPKKETSVIVTDILKYLNQENDYACKVICSYNTKIAATNYVNTLKRPLMRFGLIKMQTDQNMTARCYKYIPDIDWSDSKTQTDEGILEMVGFSKKEAKEFAKYVKDFVEKFDKEYKPKSKKKSKKKSK